MVWGSQKHQSDNDIPTGGGKAYWIDRDWMLFGSLSVCLFVLF